MSATKLMALPVVIAPCTEIARMKERKCNIVRHPNARISDPHAFRSCAGAKYHVLYESRFNGQALSLVEVGREEIQPKIDAYQPYTDLVYMLSRLKVNDFSVLNQRRAMYGDFSQLPDNPVDAINLVHGASDAFGRLSADEKQKYNNDYRVWLAQLFTSGSPVTDVVDPQPAEPAVKEGESDES